MSATLELTRQLINRESVTPDDCGCQEILITRLKQLGFHIVRLPFGEVNNFWARYGDASPLLAFAGHTDVVPPGELDSWNSPPFEPTEKEGRLYGRGAADMKSSLAAMVIACENFLARQTPKGSIGFLITSDEEGPAENGTVKVVDWLKQNNVHIDYCVVGEPSSAVEFGDTLKIGRRGSLNGGLTIKGVQGHVAYPDAAVNPIHTALPALAELSSTIWDNGNKAFPQTTFQISNIHGGAGAVNVIPETLKVNFNFRFSPELDAATIKQRCESILDKYSISYEIDWRLSGNPFYTPPGKLTEMVCASIEEVTGQQPELSTSGGTSDGRFIASEHTQVVEFGPINASIHKVNENTDISELDKLALVYEGILQRL